VIRWDALRNEAESDGVAWPVDDSINDLYGRFMAIARTEKVTMVGEGRPIEWLKSVVEAAESQPAQPR
jgi:hypothetical protein